MATTDRLSGPDPKVAVKAPCRLATTANISSLSGFQTIDGVLPTAQDHADLRRILVKNQTDASANGIYEMQSGTWERTRDFDGVNDFRQGTRVFVWGGSTQSGGYTVTSSMNPSTFQIDDDDISFSTDATVSLSNFQFADGTGLLDDSGNSQLILQKTSGAGNYLEITNSTAGSAPQLSAAGVDSVVNLKLTAKSTGAVTSTSVVQFDAAVTSSAITASGTVTVNAGLVSSAITASGAITANGAIVSTSITASGGITANAGITSSAVTANGAGTFNAPVASTAITASGLITANAGIASTAITATGPITSTAITASGLITANGGFALPITNATSATTATDLLAYGISIISSAETTWRMDAPQSGVSKYIIRLATSTTTTGTITLESGSIVSSAVSTANSIAMTGACALSLLGVSTSQYTVVSRFPSTSQIVIT